MTNKDAKRPTIKRKEYELQPLSESFVMPVKAKRGSIGYDLTCPEDFVVPAYSRCAIPMRFAINLPYGVEAKIEPRSGFSLKGIEGVVEIEETRGGITILGHTFFGKKVRRILKERFDADVMVGKVDPNYIDEVHVLLKNCDESFTIQAGTRIAQMTFYSVTSPFYKLVDKLTCKSRGGGLGSSGTKRIERKPKVEEMSDEVVAEPAPHVFSEEEIEDINHVDVM